jgi:hypothetical protein
MSIVLSSSDPAVDCMVGEPDAEWMLDAGASREGECFVATTARRL